MYLFEVGYRLAAAGLPDVRLSITSGYTLLTGAWRGIEPGRGLGSFFQNSQIVPFELGASWSPGSVGPFSPYVGAAFALGFVTTELQRYSLRPVLVSGVAVGASVSAGLRLRLGAGVLVLDLRHTELAVNDRDLARSGQDFLPSTAATGGYLLSF
jgi:hypothetical protein